MLKNTVLYQKTQVFETEKVTTAKEVEEHKREGEVVAQNRVVKNAKMFLVNLTHYSLGIV